MPAICCWRSCARIPLEVEKGWSLYVADDRGTLAAMLALHLPRVYLDQLFVAPEYQGQNVGRRLLAFTRQLLPDEREPLGPDLAPDAIRHDNCLNRSAKGGFAMMKLYWSPRSRSFSALWLMEETGQPYERVLTDISTGAQKAPEFLAINPMAKVPALRDGDAALAEAAAIWAYVTERYPEAKLAPPLGDPRRAKYLYWLFFVPGCIEPAMVQVATKIEMNSVAAGWGDAQRVFDVLDAALTKGPWILGETFSAADIMIGSGLNFAVRLFKMVPSRPSFDRYIDRCTARPAFQRASAIAAG